uniref:hypothetical protein n=1 Tax=Candidatus Ventrimonas sp. TaxID=3048889 RepID=UPI003FED9E9C
LTGLCAYIAWFRLFCKILASLCAYIAKFSRFCKIAHDNKHKTSTRHLKTPMKILNQKRHCKTGFSHQIWHTHSK